MKIVIPIDSKQEGAGVCLSFGRAPYFLVYDKGSNEKKVIENTAAQSPGGAGIKAAQLVVDSKATVLLTPRCGENAAGVLKAAKIKIYQTDGTSVKNNIDAFNSGRLSELNDIHPGFHGRGGK